MNRTTMACAAVILAAVALGCGRSEFEARTAPISEPEVKAARPSTPDLMTARAGHRTRVFQHPNFHPGGPADEPPAGVYQLIRYSSPAGKLAAYLTPDPGD